ncbi:class III extradiol dioxygenase subunit B-like domain-containing protein [Propionispora vibrioides]|uniref:AmmeMemoRadiSam system protein B n=1 Tax=Propionispora vibrioides TaxID=112903 RepID=A0A1H8WDG0_9FIRM|nr:class III extradiol dioxygenase subunit B-like domain-containing protein [Propionispora vibrioides]SEP25694.1 AmmeMemoRadiSam system protein B [Propionispora vibrioides]
MNNLVACALMPHPPVMIPEIGREDIQNLAATVKAAERVAQRIKENNTQTVVILSPHGPALEDTICVSIHPRLKGNLADFGAAEVMLAFETDGLLTRHILKKAARLGVNVMELTDDQAKTHQLSLALDYGSLIPLYYLHKGGFKGQLVHLSAGGLPYEEMYTFGKAVQAAIKAVGKKVAVIASGELSHRLSDKSPQGYSPQGAEFDKQVLAAVASLNSKAVLTMDKELVAEAGECALPPLAFLMGVVGGLDMKADVLAYEGPFGVGYGTVLIQPLDKMN